VGLQAISQEIAERQRRKSKDSRREPLVPKKKDKERKPKKDDSDKKSKKHQAHNLEVTTLVTELVDSCELEEDEDLQWFLDHTTNSNKTEESKEEIESSKEIAEFHHLGTKGSNDKDAKTTWVMDSGCTHHMTNCKSKLEKPEKSDISIITALGGVDSSGQQHIGSVHMECLVNNEKNKITLEEVLSIPDLRRNLLSVSQICEKDQDINVIFNSKGFIVERSGAKLLEGRLAGGLYLLDEINQHEANVVEISDKLRTWHERLGHLSISNMKMLAEQIEDKDVRKELDAITTDTKIECVACDQGKMARRKIPKKNDLEIKEIGDVTYSDLSGKISPESRGGMQYYATFTDGKSRYSTIYFLRKKSEAIQKFKEYWNTLNTQKGIRLKKLVTDEGSEYCNKEFEEFCKKKGIKHVVTPPYTPQKNGVSERLNRTLMDKARSMMKAKNVGLTSWAEAVNHANYLRNLSPTQKLKKMTPYEVFHNEKPDLSMLRTFGCRVFIKNNAHKKKLANRSVVGVLMGIQDRNYRIWNIKRKAIELSRDVIFYEKEGDERSQEEEIEYDQVVESEEESTTTASSTKTTTISSESSASSESESSETRESSKESESSEASESSKESESS
jgi:transposase InsO family protein